MKKLFFFGFFLSVFLFSEAQESYVMYETMYINPKADRLKEFNESLTAHNKKFHSSGANGVTMQYVVNGPKSGQLVWVMGPTTFTDLDNRPDDEGHTDDWNMVMANIKSVSDVEYWKMDDDLSYNPVGSKPSAKLHIRIWEIKPGKSDEVEGFLKNVAEVFRTKKYPRSWNVYWNSFNSGDGRDVAAVSGFEKYARFDEEGTWVKDYEGIHGEGSWADAMAMMSKAATMVEEVRERLPELSGVVVE